MRHPSLAPVTTSLLRLAVTACSDSSRDDAGAGDTGEESFTLSRRAVVGGELLAQFQCEEKIDGVEESIPLERSGVPDGTASLAVTMHHYPNPDDETAVSGYLQPWNIDPDTTGIDDGAADDGSWYLGADKDGAAIAYSSPCSAGAGTLAADGAGASHCRSVGRSVRRAGLDADHRFHP